MLLSLSGGNTLAVGSSAVQAVYRGSELKHFNPRSIPGIEAWWDAADASTVTLDGGRVAALADKSGNDRHATNSTSGSTQPDYVTAASNGRNVARFDAASTQRLTVPSSTAMFNFIHNGGNAYLAWVASAGVTADPNAALAYFGNYNGNDDNVGFLARYEDRAAVRNDSLWVAISSAGFTVRPLIAQSAAGSVPPQVVHVLEAEINADIGSPVLDRGALRINGNAAVKSNTQTGAPSTANAGHNFTIGAAGGNAQPLTGDICEILIYSQHPTDAARTALRRYLATKWGVTLA